MDGIFLRKWIWGVVVFLLTALLFTVFWQEDWELANHQVTSVRFGFYRVMEIEAVCGLGIAWFAWKRIQFNRLDGMVVVFCSYLVGRSLLSGEPVVFRVELVTLLFLLYGLLRLLLSLSEEATQVLLLTLAGAMCVEGIWGIAQLYGGVYSGHALYRLTGSFFNPGPYAGFLVTGFPVALAFYLEHPPAKITGKWLGYGVKSITGVALLLVFVLLPATLSRSAWLAAIAGGGIVLGRYYRLWDRGRKWVTGQKRRFAAVALIGLMLLVGFAAGIYTLKKDSADGRMLIWKVCLLAMKERPWTGVGTGRFGGAFGEAQAAYFASGSATSQEEWVAGVPEYGFNEYLQMGVEGGVIGLVLFGAVLVFALVRLCSSVRTEKVATLGSLTAFLVFACFSYPLGVLPLCLVFVMLIAIAATPLECRWQEKDRLSGNIRRWGTLGLAGGIAVVVWGIVGSKGEERKAYVRWREEQSYFNMAIYKGTELNYGELYPFLRQQPRFLFEYGQCLSQTEQYEASNRILQEATRLSADPMFFNIMGKNEQALQRTEAAADYFCRAAATVPNRMYPLYLLCRMYFESGQTVRGIKLGKELLEKKPKVMSEAVKEMKSEIQEWINQNQ